MNPGPNSIPSAIPDLCCIGHITHDRVITPTMDVHMPGGTAYYFAKAIRNLAGDRGVADVEF